MLQQQQLIRADVWEQTSRALREYLRDNGIDRVKLSADSDGLTLWGSLARTWGAYVTLRLLGYRLLTVRQRKGIRVLRMVVNPTKLNSGR